MSSKITQANVNNFGQPMQLCSLHSIF